MAEPSPLAVAIGRFAADFAMAAHCAALMLASIRRPFVKPNPKLERVTNGR